MGIIMLGKRLGELHKLKRRCSESTESPRAARNGPNRARGIHGLNPRARVLNTLSTTFSENYRQRIKNELPTVPHKVVSFLDAQIKATRVAIEEEPLRKKAEAEAAAQHRAADAAALDHARAE